MLKAPKHYLFWAQALLLTALQVQAAYYETLPKGVRLFAARQVQTTDIKNNFSQSGQKESLSFNQSLTSQELSQIDGADVYFDELKNISEEAYEMFRVGAYDIDAHAEVNVQGFGLAYGITDRLTSYISIPYYRADVSMNVKRTQDNNYQAVASLLNQSGQESDSAYFLNQLTGQLPDADGELLQTVLVKNYGYQPLGNWKAQGLGDIELTGLYRLTDWQDSGLATSFGVTLPTGREANPDILQDIAFGDGQTDIFLEFGGGVSLLESKLELDASLRYTHQFGSDKIFRVPENEDMQFSDQKAEFYENLGQMWTSHLMASYHLNDWLTLQGGHEFMHEALPEYDSPYKNANEILSRNGGETYHIAKAGIKFSTIKLYHKGKFAAPLTVQLLGRRTLGGRNTPEVTRFDLEFRLFF